MALKEVLADANTVKLPHPASTAIARGDLLFWNTTAVAKASAQTDQLTEAANQALFASLFMGVAGDTRLSTETSAGNRIVIADGVFDITCPSSTWEVGDLVGADEAANGTELENQQVVKVTDPTLAIGYCVQREGSATTTVRARLFSKYTPNVVQSAVKKIPTDRATQTAVTDTATITAAQLLTKVLDGTPTGAATYTLPTAALLVAALPGVAVGDSFTFLVNNKSGGANTITMAAGTGGTADGTLTVAQHVIRPFTIIFTNVTESSEAYFVYGQG